MLSYVITGCPLGLLPSAVQAASGVFMVASSSRGHPLLSELASTVIVLMIASIIFDEFRGRPL